VIERAWLALALAAIRHNQARLSIWYLGRALSERRGMELTEDRAS
jgi:hypothetical protein